MLNVLTVDVEEYFHAAEVQRHVSEDRLTELPSRINDQVLEILDLTEKKGIKATFFILGWVAEHSPRTIRSIVGAGHEVGCHGYFHRLINRLSPEDFRRDTQRAVAAIEDACGVTPRAYRAPNYSVTRDALWALEVLVEQGFAYDSSIYPIAHDRYGIPGSERHAHVIHTPSGPIQEIPIATVKLPNGSMAPIGGGGYLRLLPYQYTAAGIRRVNREERQPVCIYFHPWEIDASQPRLATGFISRTRTYAGLKGMRSKLERLLSDFRFSTLSDVHGKGVLPAPVSGTIGAD